MNCFKMVLIEDTCESMGAKWKDKPAGSFGRVSSFSSYFSHHICTLEGGLTCFKFSEIFKISCMGEGCPQGLGRKTIRPL